MLGVGWLIGGAVVGGLISAFSNGYQAYNSAKAQNEQIDYQKQQLEKQKDQLSWVGLMNNYKSCAEEIVLQELIFN